MKFIILMILATNAHAWGTPATATAPITANITGWTEDPCDFPEHQNKCDPPPIQPERQATDYTGTSYSFTTSIPIPNMPYVQQDVNYE